MADITVNVVLGTVARASFGLVTVQVPVLFVVHDAEPPVLHVPVTTMPLALPSAAVWARIGVRIVRFLPDDVEAFVERHKDPGGMAANG